MGLWKNLMTKNWYKRKEHIKPLPKIDLEWSPGFIIKDEVNDHVLLALSKENHDKLHRYRNDAVDALCCAANTLWKIDYTDDKDEWVKANPNAQFFNIIKWEEFKDMKKKEIRNVGFENTVMVPVDVKTNLASIDADELRILYMSRDNMANSFYGASCYPCTCINCPSNIAYSTNAFAKAAKALAEHVKAGKPTYDQLLEENEKLRKENRELKCKSCGKHAEVYTIDDIIGATGHVDFSTYNELRKECEELRAENEVYKERNISLRDDIDVLRSSNDYLRKDVIQLRKDKESLQAEIDELDKECDALIEEKEQLQAAVDTLKHTVKGYEKKNTELIKELVTCKNELESMTNMADYYRKYYLEH